MTTLSPGMLEKRTSGGGVCVGGVAAYGRSQPADSTQHTGSSTKNSANHKIDQSRKGKIVAPVSQAESRCLVFVRILVGDHPRNAHFRVAT